MMAKLYTKSNVRMSDLIEKVLGIKAGCKDIILSGAYTGRRGSKKETGALNPGLTAATVSLKGDYSTLDFLAPIGNDGQTMLSMPVSAELTDWSFYQLCSVRPGVPHAFMRKCMSAEEPDIRVLFPTTVNTYMKHFDGATMIRLYKPDDGPLKVRGIVSGSYAVFDSDKGMTRS